MFYKNSRVKKKTPKHVKWRKIVKINMTIPGTHLQMLSNECASFQSKNNVHWRGKTDGQVENNILLKLREKLMLLRQFRNTSILKGLPLRWIFLWILTDTVTVDKCQLDYASTVTCFLFSFYAIQFIGNMYQI